jgi:hypothetical protein
LISFNRSTYTLYVAYSAALQLLLLRLYDKIYLERENNHQKVWKECQQQIQQTQQFCSSSKLVRVPTGRRDWYEMDDIIAFSITSYTGTSLFEMRFKNIGGGGKNGSTGRTKAHSRKLYKRKREKINLRRQQLTRRCLNKYSCKLRGVLCCSTVTNRNGCQLVLSIDYPRVPESIHSG